MESEKARWIPIGILLESYLEADQIRMEAWHHELEEERKLAETWRHSKHECDMCDCFCFAL